MTAVEVAVVGMTMAGARVADAILVVLAEASVVTAVEVAAAPVVALACWPFQLG